MPHNPFIPYLNRYTTASPDHQAAFDEFIGQARPPGMRRFSIGRNDAQVDWVDLRKESSMDPQLPAQLVQFRAPYLPYLVKGVKLAGQEAAKKLGEKAGEQGFEQAKALWDKLRHKKNVEQVAQTAAALPDNHWAGHCRTADLCRKAGQAAAGKLLAQ